MVIGPVLMSSVSLLILMMYTLSLFTFVRVTRGLSILLIFFSKIQLWSHQFYCFAVSNPTDAASSHNSWYVVY